LDHDKKRNREINWLCPVGADELSKKMNGWCMKKLLFVTGTRADFGKLEPLAVAARDHGLDVSFWVTGMHMMERYGLTKIEVQRVQGVGVSEFSNQHEGDPQDVVLAKTVLGFSEFARDHQPDLVIVHGDRIEALACAIVCATNYIRCAHVEGGEVSGTIDELFRHCNTKLAFCHFVSSQSAAERVARLGEPKNSIYVIGSPELDFHSKPSGVSISMVRDHYDIPFSDYGICTFHPVTSEQDTMANQAANLFGALDASGKNFVVILPNNDPGSDDIVAAINKLPIDRFRILPSMRFSHFSELMKNAACIVGNSSAGVREAPFLSIPSLDVGTRQNARAQSVSITSARADERNRILSFLEQDWGKRYPANDDFGQGSASERFVEIVGQDAFWNAKLQKVFVDHV
jgi:UDP-N-acetylglucosamine 2-epimerase (hydrolysing)